MYFEWDENKATTNELKHGINFDEAITIFDDPLASIFMDILHSDGEERSLIVGYSTWNRLLFVSYIEHEESTRIISARLATKREIRKHERKTNFGQW